MIRFAVITRVPDPRRGDSMLGNLEEGNVYIVDYQKNCYPVEDFLPAGLASALRVPSFHLGEIVIIDETLCDIQNGRALALFDISYEVFLSVIGASQKANDIQKQRLVEFAQARNGEKNDQTRTGS